MPEICRFLGIIIRMYYDDHNPPHFHAQYGDHNAVIRIHDFALLGGKLPPKILGLVVEWTALRQIELQEDWIRAQNGEVLLKVAPLED